MLRNARRFGEDLALLLIDIDSFKKINDIHGHLAGDAVLTAVADVIRSNTRQADLLGRYGGHGGDEFLTLLPQTSVADASLVAERIQAGIRNTSLIATATSGAAVTIAGITASVGVSTRSEDDEDLLDDLIRRADHSLRIAKLDHYRQIADNSLVGQSCPQGTARRYIAAPATTIGRDTFLGYLLELQHLMNGDWIPDILIALSVGSRRYTDLLHAIRSSPVIDRKTGRNRHIQPKTLIETLRRMEDDRLVLRYGEVDTWKRSVHYELSPAAHDLLRVLTYNVAWAERHEDLLNDVARHSARGRPKVSGDD